MRFQWRKFYTGRLPLQQIFLAGLLAGILIMNFGKGALLENTGLLDEYVLYRMKYMTVDSRALFVYVFGKRLITAGGLAVLATTYLGLFVVCATCGWYGVLLGMFSSVAIIRYGLKGILFVVVSLFPHYLLFVPALIFLMAWCEQICRDIYFRRGSHSEEISRNQKVPEKLLRLVIILATVILGCVLESYVNPVLLMGLLKIF